MNTLPYVFRTRFIHIFLPAALIVLMGYARSVRLETNDSDCLPHRLNPTKVEQKLRRLRGLDSLDNWKTTLVELDRCIIDNKVSVLLTLAPPESWSHHRISHHVKVKISVDGISGRPVANTESDLKKLSGSVRRLMLSAEDYEDVRRFIERFNVKSAKIIPTNGFGGLMVSFYAATMPIYPAGRTPFISFLDDYQDGVVAYKLPRIDSLPVRPELLRCAEVVSHQHPRCRVSWISARWKPHESENSVQTEQTVRTNGYWEFDLELDGTGCPKNLSTAIQTDGTVINRANSNTASNPSIKPRKGN